MTKLCICMICTCGRHKCPHFPRGTISKDKICSITEYATKYKQHPMEPTRSFKPQEVASQYSGPLQDETTHRKDYIKHPLEQRWQRQQDAYIPPESQFDGTTNYTVDYPKKYAEPSKPIRKEATRKALGKFEGDPTYKADYRKWSAQRREPIVRDEAYQPNDAPFSGTPTYVKDYIKHPHAARTSMRPTEGAKTSDAPFEDRTGYRDEYIKHPLTERYHKDKPIYAPNPAKLDGLSSYMKEFVPKDAGKMASCKPDSNPYQSQAPFEDETTQRHDYVRKTGDRPFVHQQEAYQKPEGDMFMNTTTGTDYVPKPIERQLYKKKETVNKNPGQFNGVTNYGEDFKKWPLGERQKMTMKSDYLPPDQPFGGTPTYARDYIPHPPALRSSMKPAEGAKMSDTPFDGNTGYRDDYIKHPLAARAQKEKAAWQPNPAKLDGTSNYMKDYIAKEAGKMPSCKPDANPYQSQAPFEDETTQRHDYVKKHGDRPFVHKQEVYTKPEGDMFMNTTTHTDYVPKAGERAAIKKPVSAKRATGKFYDKTNYREDYRKLSGVERVKIIAKSDYSPCEAPFEGQPTYQRDYIKYNASPVRSLKPTDDGYRSSAPFDGNTEYKKEYIKKAVPPCPVTVINTGGNTGFEFEAQDDTGHKWYQKTGRQVLEPVSTTYGTHNLVQSVA